MCITWRPFCNCRINHLIWFLFSKTVTAHFPLICIRKVLLQEIVWSFSSSSSFFQIEFCVDMRNLLKLHRDFEVIERYDFWINENDNINFEFWNYLIQMIDWKQKFDGKQSLCVCVCVFCKSHFQSFQTWI